MLTRKYKLSITLIEAVTVIAVFAIIAATTGSILFSTSRSGRKMADKSKTFQDASWAVDYMINEARWGRFFEVNPAVFPTAELVSFESDVDRNNTTANPCVWYWRGFTDANGDFGDNTTLYRGLDDACNANLITSLQTANTTRQELTGFIVDNPEDPDNLGFPFAIFDYNSASQQFSTLLTVQDPSTPNSQALRATVVALNEGGATPSVCCEDPDQVTIASAICIGAGSASSCNKGWCGQGIGAVAADGSSIADHIRQDIPNYDTIPGKGTAYDNATSQRICNLLGYSSWCCMYWHGYSSPFDENVIFYDATAGVWVSRSNAGNAVGGCNKRLHCSNPLPRCSNNLDDDGDCLVDYPDDPGCSDASDEDERNTPTSCVDCCSTP